jgi:hypothetical protein
MTARKLSGHGALSKRSLFAGDSPARAPFRLVRTGSSGLPRVRSSMWWERMRWAATSFLRGLMEFRCDVRAFRGEISCRPSRPVALLPLTWSVRLVGLLLIQSRHSVDSLSSDQRPAIAPINVRFGEPCGWPGSLDYFSHLLFQAAHNYRSRNYRLGLPPARPLRAHQI